MDMHVHVGVLGDDPAYRRYGAISRWMRQQPAYLIMLLYARIKPGEASDIRFQEAVIHAITRSHLDQVVCLAIDPVFDSSGQRRPDRSNMWVANEYITEVLRPLGQGKIRLGASVHPYDPAFATRVKECVDDDAVLLKWLPSAQQIDLADERVVGALKLLARACPGGRPLPLLLHVGPEHAIMSTDPRTASYDFLSWSGWDRFFNAFRSREERWFTPRIKQVLANLRAGLDAGATIILAHCGLPYFAPRFTTFLEHSDFDAVRMLLEETIARPERPGKCYADVSACLTPFRQGYFDDIRKLPRSLLLAGSDFPVPVFELSAGLEENLKDFEAMLLRGKTDRIVVPQDNLLDVNWRELQHAFGDHPMFRNAAQVFPPAGT